ncbi:MAG TPA: FkbM family methyltransferase [Thermoanaerobaculia bacterium]|nr:FkbM family methyltransferase [Thermoanaerobaculia bacterium]
MTAPERRARLPNGLTVAYQSKAELEQFYEDLFEKRIYTRHGITLRPGDCVFDVGANIGLFTLSILHRFPGVRVYAFEPAPPLFELLRANTEAFGERVKLFPCGLADRPGTARLTYYPNTTGMSSFHADTGEERAALAAILENRRRSGVPGIEELLDHAEDFFTERLKSEVFDCPLRTLSDVLRQEGVERIDLLKVDVEKSEEQVLAGIEDLDWLRIEQIAAEVHDVGRRLAEIRQRLEERSFTVTLEQDSLYVGSDRHNLYAVRAHMSAITPPHAVAAGAERRETTLRQARERAERLKGAMGRRPAGGDR